VSRLPKMRSVSPLSAIDQEGSHIANIDEWTSSIVAQAIKDGIEQVQGMLQAAKDALDNLQSQTQALKG
jgi:hypothetical protein